MFKSTRIDMRSINTEFDLKPPGNVAVNQDSKQKCVEVASKTYKQIF